MTDKIKFVLKIILTRTSSISKEEYFDGYCADITDLDAKEARWKQLCDKSSDNTIKLDDVIGGDGDKYELKAYYVSADYMSNITNTYSANQYSRIPHYSCIPDKYCDWTVYELVNKNYYLTKGDELIAFNDNGDDPGCSTRESYYREISMPGKKLTFYPNGKSKPDCPDCDDDGNGCYCCEYDSGPYIPGTVVIN